MTSLDQIRLAQQAEAVAIVAAQHGWRLPATYQEAKVIHAAAQRVAAEPAPLVPDLPKKPADVPAWCDKVAAEQAAHDRRVAVARTLAERAQQTQMAAVYNAAPDIASRLIAHANDKLIPEFEELLPTAPRSISGYEDDDAMRQHRRILQLATELTMAAQGRGTLAITLGEGDDLGRHGAAFLVINPGPNALASEVAALITQCSNGLPSTLEQWARCAAVGLSFAAVGEAAARRDRFQDLRRAGGSTPDGGMRERTMRELEAIAR